MKRLALTGICALVAACIASTATAGGQLDKILEFDTMVGVAAPYTGTTNPIRGVNGGGQPWKLQSAEGEITVDGKLEIRVTGLVLTSTNGNPFNQFRAIVSCLSRSSPTSASTVNMTTDPFPANAAGDAYLEVQLDLPEPCIAPIIFVTNPNLPTNGSPPAWFAATGR